MSVYFDNRRKKYIARQTVEGKRMYIGQFDTEIEAAVAYAKAQLFEEMKKYFTLENARIDYCESDRGLTILPHGIRLARLLKSTARRALDVVRRKR